MEASGDTVGLQWRRTFEQTCLQDREKILKKAVVSSFNNGAVKSYTITRNPLLVISMKDDLVQQTVLDAIEWFLFGEEPVPARLKLSELSNPPTLCGRVFKNNEPTYSCR